MTQQTAVGYIISQLRQLAFNENTHLGMGDVRVTQGLIDELEEQAKQIEKQQIINAFDIACEDEDRIGEEYYNDIFGGRVSPDTNTSQSL